MPWIRYLQWAKTQPELGGGLYLVETTYDGRDVLKFGETKDLSTRPGASLNHDPHLSVLAICEIRIPAVGASQYKSLLRGLESAFIFAIGTWLNIVGLKKEVVPRMTSMQNSSQPQDALPMLLQIFSRQTEERLVLRIIEAEGLDANGASSRLIDYEEINESLLSAPAPSRHSRRVGGALSSANAAVQAGHIWPSSMHTGGGERASSSWQRRDPLPLAAVDSQHCHRLPPPSFEEGRRRAQGRAAEPSSRPSSSRPHHLLPLPTQPSKSEKLAWLSYDSKFNGDDDETSPLPLLTQDEHKGALHVYYVKDDKTGGGGNLKVLFQHPLPAGAVPGKMQGVRRAGSREMWYNIRRHGGWRKTVRLAQRHLER